MHHAAKRMLINAACDGGKAQHIGAYDMQETVYGRKVR